MRKLIALLFIVALLVGVFAVLGQEQTGEPPPDTAVPTDIPPTDIPPTDIPPTDIPPTDVPPTDAPTNANTPVNTPVPTRFVTFPPRTPLPTHTPAPTATPTLPEITKLDATPRIAVISAFSPEITVLLAQTQVEQTYVVNGVTFTTGKLAGNEVVLFLSGESIVNAAMTTQLGIDHFNITHILFSGIAGGVNPAYHIGDVVVAAQWGQYQEAYAAPEEGDGTYTPPDPAPFAPFAFMYPQNVNVRTTETPDGADTFWFTVDPQMLAVAQSAASAVTLASCTADNVCLTDAPQVHVGGNAVSGPTFVNNAAYREYVYNTFYANALDMETASAIMVAYANGIPFLAFRSLSDLAGGGPGANEIGTFFQLAADNSAQVTIAFLNAWASQ